MKMSVQLCFIPKWFHYYFILLDIPEVFNASFVALYWNGGSLFEIEATWSINEVCNYFHLLAYTLHVV